MSQEELITLTQGREKRTLEYKTAWCDVPENIFETVCAFLNRDGGVIVLGAQDDGTIIEGVNPRAADQMCKNIANMSNNAQKLSPQFLLQPEIVEIKDGLTESKMVIVLQVPSSSQVHATAGKIYDRSVDGDYEVRTDAERSAMYLRKSTQYSENKIYPYLKREHLDEETIIPLPVEMDAVVSQTRIFKKVQKAVQKNGIHVTERQMNVLVRMVINPTITKTQIAADISVTVKNVSDDISVLKDNGILQRKGGRKDGEWVVNLEE